MRRLAADWEGMALDSRSTGRMVDTNNLISDWRSALEDSAYESASRVQDRLLGLWGEVGPAGTALVEEWLTVTRHRSMFSADELRALLDDLEARESSLSV